MQRPESYLILETVIPGMLIEQVRERMDLGTHIPLGGPCVTVANGERVYTQAMVINPAWRAKD